MFTAKRKGLLAFFAVLLTVALISCAVIFALPEKTAHAEGAQTQTDEGQTDQTATVKSAEELKAALDNEEVSTIALGDNITADVVIAQGRTVTLDLNGFKLTNESDHTITNCGKLTIKDSSAENSGTVDNITNARGALFNLGEAVLLGGNYTRSKEAGSSVEEGGGNSWYAIKNLGYLTIGEDGKDCEVNVIQNGHFSSLITNGYYNSDNSGDHKTYYGLVTTADKIPTLTIYDGEFTGGINSIKNDNHGVMNIKGGIFNNSTQSVVLNWNNLTIDGGTFNIADDATASVITSYDSTGFNNGNTAINGGTFAGAIVADYGADNVDYSISGGEFATAVSEEFIAEDSLFYPTENGFTVGTQEQMEADPANTAVAVIGKMAYASLAEAVDAVPADNSPVTITLVGGENGVITAPGVKIVANKNITIDFNGLTYNVTDTVGSSGTETNGFQLLKGSVVTLRNGKIISSTAKILIQNYCNLTVEDMTLGGGENSVIQYVMSNNSGETHIKGNTNIIARDGWYAFDVYFWPSNGYTDVKVIFDEDFSGSVEGKVEYTSDNTKKDEWFEKAQLLISEGSTGNFDIQLQKVSADNPDQANIVIGGGTFANTIPESYISENSLFYPTEEGFKVENYSAAISAVEERDDIVAIFGNKAYSDLDEAIAEGAVTMTGKYVYSDLSSAFAAAEDNTPTEIKVIADIENTYAGSIPAYTTKHITLDLNGHNITAGALKVFNFGYGASGSLTLIGDGNVTCLAGGCLVDTSLGNVATVNILGGNYIGDKSSNMFLLKSGDTLNISGGTFEQGAIRVFAGVNSTISGGVFNSDIIMSIYGTCEISGGEFMFANGLTTGAATNLVVSGGTFAAPVAEKFIAENSLFYYTEDGYKVSENNGEVPADCTGAAMSGNAVYATLQEAVDNFEAGSVITLLKDVQLNSAVIISKSLTLDLNGFNISGTLSGSQSVASERALIVVASADDVKIINTDEKDSKISVYDGNNSDGNYYEAIYSYASDLSVENVDIYSDNYGITFFGAMTQEEAVAQGASAEFKTLNLIGSSVEVGMDAISGNGSGTCHGTTINIENSKLYAPSGWAIYHPQYGILNITGAETEISGATAIEMRSGMLSINGGTITAKEKFDWNASGNGPSMLGVAVGISQHTTNLPVEVNISGGTLSATGEGGKALYEEDLMNEDVSGIAVSITGGQFNGEVSSENVVNFIEGGTFAVKPSDECFAEGLEGIFYDGNYVVVEKVSDAGTLLTAKYNAQADVRSYAAAFGLSLTSLEALASADANAAAVVAAYEAVLDASSEGAVAVAKLAAMDAVDAFVDALNAAKAAAISEVSAYAADAENIAVAVPTYILSAINGAMSAEEINSYVASAKAEIDEIRAERKAADAETSLLQTQIDAILTVLEFVQDSSNENSAVLENIVENLAAAWVDVSDIKALLGNVADTSSNDTIIGMIKAVQDKVAEAQADIKSYVDEKTAAITADVEAMLAALDFADSSDIAALAGQLDEVSDYVYGIKASIGDLADGETLASVLAGIEYAQSALEKAVGDYKTAVETVLQGITESLSALVKDVEALGANSAADKESMLEEIAKLQATADEISDTVASLEGGSQTDLEGISEDIAKLNASLEGITENVDNLVKNNETYGSSLAGLYAFVAATVVIAIVVLVVVSVKKRR